MGSSFKQALISENTRRALSMWKRRANTRRSCLLSSRALLHETSATSTDCLLDEQARISSFSRSRMEGGDSSSGTNLPRHDAALSVQGSHETLEELMSEEPYHCIPSSDNYSGDE